METKNCSQPAPDLYISMMHNFHLISFPVYIVTLNALFRETSRMFRTYKYYISVHIFINILSESYVSFLMLPITYLPLPMLRTTGMLSEYGFSGLFQFYVLSQLVMTTVGSILEMFLYRFTVTVIHQNHTFKNWLKFQVFLYRFLIVSHPIITTITLSFSLELEDRERMELWMSNPTLPPEITCYSVILAILDDYVFWIILTIYSIQVVLQLTVSSGTLMSITHFMRESFGISKSTFKMQKMLIVSLFIQGGIHGFMIMIPTMFLIYALFFNSTQNELALSLLMCVAYHGFASTCAMIAFTKPLRDRILPFRKADPQTNQSSKVASAITQDGQSNKNLHRRTRDF